MSEMHTSERLAMWLETELVHQLAPVTAPGCLWNRIQEQEVPRHSSSFRPAWWLVLAGLLMTVCGVIGWHISRASDRAPDMEKLAQRELKGLASGSIGLNLYSENATKIRTWVKTKANVDIDVPIERSGPMHGSVQLLGASLIRQHGLAIASVAYRADNQVATLLVARTPSASSGNTGISKHLSWRIGSGKSARLFSWSMGDQVYTLASSDTSTPRGACILCHLDAHGQTILN